MGYLFLNTDDEGFNLKRSCELNEWDERVGFNEFSLDFFLKILFLVLLFEIQVFINFFYDVYYFY